MVITPGPLGNWLIGQGLLAPGINGVALRSMKAPGTAYDDPQLGGKDPQPATMADYVETFDDPPIRLRGYGHYHERYVKEADGSWRIAELQLSRLRVDDL